MINQCPACDSPIADTGTTLGHCSTCGWEFVSFISPFETGENLLQKRLALAKSFLHQLREGNEEDKLEIKQLKLSLENSSKLLSQKEAELNSLQEQFEKMKSDLDQAIGDQNFILLNQNYRGHQVRVEYFTNHSGDIHLESKEPITKLPTLTMIIKRGDVFVADPRFGSDGTYAGIVHPNMWRTKSQLSFVLESSQLSRIFPCLSGNYTFSLASAQPKFEFNRKGKEKDLFYVQLKF